MICVYFNVKKEIVIIISFALFFYLPYILGVTALTSMLVVPSCCWVSKARTTLYTHSEYTR